MAKPTCFHLSHIVLSIVVHVLFVNHNIATATSNNDEISLIKKSCSSTQFPNTCVSVLEADSRSRNATNLKSLTRISMDIVCEEVIVLKSLFIKAEENITDPVLKHTVEYCLKEFEDCIYHMKKYAIPSFEKGDYAKANDKVNVCVISSDDCHDTGIKLFSREIVTLFNFKINIFVKQGQTELRSSKVRPNQIWAKADPIRFGICKNKLSVFKRMTWIGFGSGPVRPKPIKKIWTQTHENFRVRVRVWTRGS
ncbi:hypothetical protein Dsin_021934 [Dipteronia sinensis]|uniref:Pectinesterase inhibitor domain-containing protein n=1 Tax=Dipteronia sinensis TaxID=43782 RepID=A0AAE0DZL4_9ROSI|nr:hypothetical protein Dsin_021934 [Dipteronia sinensis]